MAGGGTLGLIADLARVYPSSFAKLSQRQIEDLTRLYVQELEDIPSGLLSAAVRDLIRTEKWLPSIAAIRERAAERALELPDEAGALAQVEARMQWTRLPEAERGPERPTVHPLVREAVDHVGGWHAFRATQDAARLRSQFGRLYAEIRGRALREFALGAGVRPV